MTQNGWQAFFDATAHEYMDEEYAQPWSQEVDFYLKVLDLSPDSRILDLGCGPGRHTVEMARRGYQVTGVDFSRGMLTQAQNAAQQANVNVEWVCCDATQFKASELYDGCICALEAAFGFLTPEQDPTQHDLAILQNINAALKPDARFILGVSNPFKSIQENYTQASIESGYFDPVHMLQEHELTWTTSNGVEERAKVRVRVYMPTEITKMLEESGFVVEHMWGGSFGRKPIILDDYIITVVARKVGVIR